MRNNALHVKNNKSLRQPFSAVLPAAAPSVPESCAPSNEGSDARLRAAEFFAGIGLVRCGLESAGINVVWANDIEPVKRAVYAANFSASDFVLGDVRQV